MEDHGLDGNSISEPENWQEVHSALSEHLRDVAVTFAVGSLVRARGREWVVLPDSGADLLMLRPLVAPTTR